LLPTRTQLTLATTNTVNAPDDSCSQPLAGAGQMPSTHWSVVLHAGDSASPQAQTALETLCRAYWYPLYAWLRFQGQAEHDAKDLLQEFFFALLEKKRLKAADPERGRFRSFLLKALTNFTHDQRDKHAALKRGAGQVLSWEGLLEQAEDRYRLEPRDQIDPAKLYERAWTTELIEQTFARLRGDFPGAEKQKRFAVLIRLLPGKDRGFSQADAARELGLSEEAVGKAVFDLRRRFAKLFRETVGQTVASHEDLEDEIQCHLNVFGD
jgi:RNA polymerase sigma-70 factor (ECF subfamily)